VPGMRQRRYRSVKKFRVDGDVTPMSPDEKAADDQLLARGRAIQSRKRELRQAKDEAIAEIHQRWIAPRRSRLLLAPIS
jgi:hypothetical protein